ncbi:AraC family transcriptional regulator [Nocardia sp. alder85J]|uniref:AraC family transcriptional regulator n=1 Tax=Nocardia sp. alder85J TaxID=2862949 RepID=UPI001CD57878|nr:AraC family transcriptional regulator [Nocardia sp. alder85J]MCX4094374.1 AraC family transcriptional regulator [Nocardia sp. alder85J]
MDVLSDVVAELRVGAPHASRTEQRTPWDNRFEATDAVGFHIVLGGSSRLLTTGGQPVLLGPRDVVLLPRGDAHSIAAAPGAAASTVLLCGAYRFDRSRHHPLLSELPAVIHLPARTRPPAPLDAAVDLLAREIETTPESGAVGPLLEVLLLYILRTWYDGQEQPTGWGAALRDPDLGAVLRAIHRDPAHPWTVRTLGARVNMSRSTFAQRFTDTVGLAPQTYLTRWRMTLAARRLRDTGDTLRVVAENVGYTSEYAFAKAFKREYGVAPGRYRHTPGSPDFAATGSTAE